MTLHPWPQLALHPQHDWWDPDASHASSSPILSFLRSFASMCSSTGRCLLTRRNHINIHVCPRSDCCRGKLLKNSSSCSFYTLSVSSRKSCANLIVTLATVTAAATRLAFPCHTTWSITSEELRPSRIFFSLLALSGIALPLKLHTSISRDASERSHCVSRCQYAPRRKER